MKNASEHREEFTRIKHVQFVMESMFDEVRRDLDDSLARAKRVAGQVDPIGMSVIQGSNGAKSVSEVEIMATRPIEAVIQRALADLRASRHAWRGKINESLTLVSFKIQEAERVPS